MSFVRQRSDGSWAANISEPIKIFVAVLYVFAFVYVCKADRAHAFMNDEQSGKHPQVSEARASQLTSPSKDQEDVLRRAKYIKKLIRKNKEWGGHSPIPSRVTTVNTFNAVKKEIGIEDSAVLMVLLQDDDYGTRSLSASLLECVNPNARNEIEKLMSAEVSRERQSRLREALVDIEMIRAGGTSCK